MLWRTLFIKGLGCGLDARTVVIQLGALTFCDFFFSSVVQGRNCYLKVERILGGVEHAF